MQESAVKLMTGLLDALQGGSSGTPVDAAAAPSSAAASDLPGSKAAATRPFLLSMPPLGTVRSLYNFPPEYLPLLHQPRAVSGSLTRRFEWLDEMEFERCGTRSEAM